jgi:peptidoglycan/xylan/chitin deacetylase (PgdA/CDA1 family)
MARAAAARTVTSGALAALLLTGCGMFGSGHHPTTHPSTVPVAKTTVLHQRPAAPLVAWHGPVMNIFFHPLVLQPRLAFTKDWLGVGFQDYFVTAYEYRRILDGLWRHGWTLVNAEQAAAGHVEVPNGRKPLVLSEDDVNYYRYFQGRGLAARLVVTRDGQVLAEVGGAHPHTTVDDVVPLVDRFVAEHPDFSVDGAKGVLGLTGYEGLLGYHDLSNPVEQEQVSALAARLKQDGWLLASHTYGHIDLTTDSLATIARDTRRWKALAQPLIGRTNLLIYPFGARPTDAGIALLRRAGFTVQFDIDIRPRRYHRDGVAVMSRLHIDGFAFQAPWRMRPLFSVRRVLDPKRPWPLETTG